MKYAFFFVVILFPIPLVAQELPIANHVDVCGDSSIEMSDEELSQMHACTLEQRDAMGYLMERWEDFSDDVKQKCLDRSREESSVDYVELYACTQAA